MKQERHLCDMTTERQQHDPYAYFPIRYKYGQQNAITFYEFFFSACENMQLVRAKRYLTIRKKIMDSQAGAYSSYQFNTTQINFIINVHLSAKH